MSVCTLCGDASGVARATGVIFCSSCFMATASPRRLVSSREVIAREIEVQANALRSWAGKLDRAAKAKSWADVAAVRADLVATALGYDAIAKGGGY